MDKLPIHLETRDAIGERRHSPSAERNKYPIGEVLADILPPKARVLEIASGTGQHAAHICKLRPDILWQPSDPDPESRQSQNAWALDSPSQIASSLDLDMTGPGWWTGLQGFNVIFCANMIHIAPWEAALGLMAGAEVILPQNGLFILYGPFLDEEKTAPSNSKFSKKLQQINVEWGVRRLRVVKDIMAERGFKIEKPISMPRDNSLLIFDKII